MKISGFRDSLFNKQTGRDRQIFQGVNTNRLLQFSFIYTPQTNTLIIYVYDDNQWKQVSNAYIYDGSNWNIIQSVNIY